MSRLQLGCGFGLHVGIDRVIRDFVGFVNRRRFGLLLGRIVILLQFGELQFVDAVEDAVKFRLKAFVRPDLSGTSDQQVERAIKVRLGIGFLAGIVKVQPCLILLLDFINQFGNGIGFGLGVRLRCGCLRRDRSRGCSLRLIARRFACSGLLDRRRRSLMRGRHAGYWLFCRLASQARQ